MKNESLIQALSTVQNQKQVELVAREVSYCLLMSAFFVGFGPANSNLRSHTFPPNLLSSLFPSLTYACKTRQHWSVN